MPCSSLPAAAPATRIYRNHYGLIAESEYGNSLYTTMRTYSGKVVTSLSQIVDRRPGVRVSEPTNENHVHHFQGSLTQCRLAIVHKEGVDTLVRRLAGLYF